MWSATSEDIVYSLSKKDPNPSRSDPYSYVFVVGYMNASHRPGGVRAYSFSQAILESLWSDREDRTRSRFEELLGRIFQWSLNAYRPALEMFSTTVQQGISSLLAWESGMPFSRCYFELMGSRGFDIESVISEVICAHQARDRCVSEQTGVLLHDVGEHDLE
jgi:hypothetical protein